MAENSDLGEKVRLFFEKFSLVEAKGVYPQLLESGDVRIFPLCKERPIVQLQSKEDPEATFCVPATDPLVIYMNNTNYEIFREPYKRK